MTEGVFEGIVQHGCPHFEGRLHRRLFHRICCFLFIRLATIWGSTLPGRPEEFHLQPPTEPCVNLSIYTARPSHSLPSRDDRRRRMRSLLPISRLATAVSELGHPLRSTLITSASSLLPDDPPPPCASVLSPFVFRTYRVFPWHRMKSSQVPCPSPD